MKNCAHCGVPHSGRCDIRKVKLVKNLSTKDSQVKSKFYEESHEVADKTEKHRYPKGYQILKKDIRHLKQNELMGAVKKGKVEVEKKFANHKNEIALHERTEMRRIDQLRQKHHK